MTHRDALNEAPRVDAIDGEVAMVGPGRVAASLTPEAARETSRRLSTSADEAEGQGPPSPEP